LYDSPYIKSKYNSGVITISKEDFAIESDNFCRGKTRLEGRTIEIEPFYHDLKFNSNKVGGLWYVWYQIKVFLREIREFDACIGTKVVQNWTVSGPLFSLRNFKDLVYLVVLYWLLVIWLFGVSVGRYIVLIPFRVIKIRDEDHNHCREVFIRELTHEIFLQSV